jgi:transketolase
MLDLDQVNAIAVPRCKGYRKRILEISQQISALHMAPAFSCVEIVDCIYNFLMRDDRSYAERDVFVMSKGHGCMIQFVILVDKGILPKQDLDDFGKDGGRLGVHPDYGLPGVEASTGSLGHGLGLCVGMSYADKINKQDNITYCVISDGELQEGSTWESILMASTLKLNNLVLFVDNNNFISVGRTSDNFPHFHPLPEKFSAFGWEVYTVNGHNSAEIYSAAVNRTGTKPCVIICDTVKGKGVSFMESQAIWHYRSPSADEYKLALHEIEEGIK